MFLQTQQLLHLSLPDWYYVFVIGGTICSYNLHWYLTDHNDSQQTEPVRLHWTLQHKPILLPMAVAGLFMAALAAFYLLSHWLSLLIGIIIASLYTAPKVPGKLSMVLKKIAVAKTIYLSLAWTYVTSILPVIIAGDSFSNTTHSFIWYRFFLVFSICILFDFRDREVDREHGIRSLITYFSGKGNTRLYYFSLAAALIAAFFFGRFSATIQASFLLMIPLAMLLLLFPKVRVVHNDYLYYFVLDGLMVFSLLFTCWL